MNEPFEVGKTYHNRYGRYQVLAINGPKMAVRYEDGREINLTIDLQVQILEGIERAEAEAAASTTRKRIGGAKKRAAKAGPTKADKREKLAGEILENDEAIFEILARMVIPPGQINIYRFFLQHPTDFYSQQQIANASKSPEQESLRGVFMAFGRRIGGSPDERVKSISPRNALFFEQKRESGESLYHIRPRIVQIFETYPQFHDFLINDDRLWLPEEFGSPEWENSTAVHHAQLQFFGFWDRYQESQES